VAARWNSSRAPLGRRNRSGAERSGLLALGNVTGHVAPPSEGSRHLTGWRLWTATGLECAGVAVELARPIEKRGAVVRQYPLAGERLATRADVDIALMIVGEVLTREGAILARRLVKDRHVRLDPLS
jgi:hypothetical protein